jgi:ribose 1,5-bisphosphokinase
MTSQTTGQLVCVVGPSGAGKDAVMRGVAAAMPEIHLARRVITRPAHDDSEEYDSVTDAGFAALQQAGHFLFHWQAHGLSYGVPAELLTFVRSGQTVLFNGSRAALSAMRQIYPDLRVFVISVSPETLAERLQSRGRETAEEIAGRLRRQVDFVDETVEIITNDGALADSVASFVSCLQRPAGGGE